MKVGFIGIGAMGLAAALRLRERGFAVAVRDVDAAQEALAREAGCSLAATPAELARAVDVLIIAVVDGVQTHEVLFGADGAAHGLAAGSTVLLCPTIAPQDVEAAAAALQPHGVQVLDAPMSGGPQRAREGAMSLMVAGAEAAWQRCQPVLQALSSRLFRIGERPGDGARTKLVNNLLAAVNLAGAAEALALAQQLGLDAAATLAVIEQSSGQSWIGSDRAQRWLAGDATVRARIALLAKDSALALAAARQAGAVLPVGGQAAAAFARAVAAGLADADDAGLFSLPPPPC
jgi:3-hydroxyisobutyrate dehydrogenase